MSVLKLLERLPIWIFHCLFIMVPLTFTLTNEELFEFPKILLVYGCAILLLTLWIMKSILLKRVLFPKTPLTVPILLFLGSQCISTLFSIEPHTSIFGYYTRFHGGLLSWFAYSILFFSFILFVRQKHIRSLIISILVGGLLSALYAFPEHFGHSPSCLIFTGSFDVACWVQDVQSRIFGTFGQPNWLAAYLAMLIPITLALAQEATAWKRRLIPLALGGFFLVVLLYTRSRSGLGALLVALTVWGILSAFMGLRTRTFKHHLLFPGITALVVIITMLAIGTPLNERLFGWILPTTQQVESTIQTPNGTALELGGSESGDIRKVVWKGALAVWKRYPLVGSGVETFAYSYFRDRPQEHNLLSEWDFLYNKAHNEFLNFLATTGILGLATYLILLTAFLVVPLRQLYLQKNTPHRYWIIASSSALIGLAVSNFFGFSTVMVTVLMMTFPAISVVVLSKDHEDTAVPPMGSGQYYLIGALALVGLFLLGQVYRQWHTDTIFAQGKQAMTQGDLQNGFLKLQESVLAFPNEPTYRDDLAYAAGRIAVAFAGGGQSTEAARFASFAIAQSNETIKQNPVHTNFYKTQARLYLLLSQMDPGFAASAEATLQTTRLLSPTDPKLVTYQALIANLYGDHARYEQLLKEVISLKPNDEQAHMLLADLYASQSRIQDAISTYETVIKSINPNNTAALERIASLSARPQK